MTAFADAAVSVSASHPSLLIIVAFIAAAGEALILVGVVVPGTAVLIGIAAVAAVAGQASLVAALIGATILGAIVGDGVSYWLGRRLGPELFNLWPLSRYPHWLTRGRAFFARHGGKSVFLGRFVPGVKTVIPAVAGMGGMKTGPFVVANLASALIWGPVTILMGLGVGHGLNRTGLADPRIVILAGAFLLVLVLAYVVLRLVLVRGMPILVEGHRRLLDGLGHRSDRLSRAARRVLSNEDGVLVALVWAGLAAFALFGFVMLVGQVVFDAGFSRADTILSNMVQSLRFAGLDRLMIAVTMAGDGSVQAVLAVAVLVWLLVHRQWRTAAGTGLVFALTLAFVPAMKALFGRERPHSLYDGADAFSFPSGHATLSLVTFGVIAILLAHNLSLRARLGVYMTAIALALLIAVSRIYLGAHWPSDVAGGLLFGSTMVAALAYLLRNHAVAIHPLAFVPVLATVFAIAYGLHLERGYAVWAENYTYAPRTVAIDPQTWRDRGATGLPPARITFDSDDGRPFVAQIAADPGSLAGALARLGWTDTQTGATGRVLSFLLPRGPIDNVPPATRLHDGALPALTLTRPAGPDGRRPVLRIWASSFVLDTAGRPPLLLVDLTVETYRDIAFGFGDLDTMAPTAAEIEQVMRDLRQAVPGDAAGVGTIP